MADVIPAYLARMQDFFPSRTELLRNGFVLEPLTAEQLELKKRCERCNSRVRPTPTRPASNTAKRPEPARQVPVVSLSQVAAAVVAKERWAAPTDPFAAFNPFPKAFVEEPRDPAVPFTGSSSQDGANESRAPKKKLMRCKYHNGHVNNRFWTCCRRYQNKEGCQSAEHHTMRTYAPGTGPEAHWVYHRTPSPAASSSLPSTIRTAVALDCEMGMGMDNDSELIRVTLIDYFSSEVLIDRLVYPDVPLKHYNTQYSGVSRARMEAALQQDRCIRGKAKAREEVWRFVGPDTVVVGHALQNDLSALRWIHERVLDSYLLEKALRDEQAQAAAEADGDGEGEDEVEEQEARQTAERGGTSSAGPQAAQAGENRDANKGAKNAPRKRGTLSLKNLVLERLGRHIQRGNRGHDSLEDAVAARDLVNLHVTQTEETMLQAL